MNRNQWINFPGAPVTRALTAEASLNKDIIGLGGVLISDNTDIFKRMSGQFNYSYKVRLADSSSLFFGLAAGFQNVFIDFNKARFRDGGDPFYFNQPQNRTSFDGSGGIVFNFKRLNVGLSIPQMFNTEARFLQDQKEGIYNLTRHFVGSIDYLHKFKNSPWSVKPIFLAKKGQSAPFQFDFMAIASHNENFWGAFAYRTAYGFTGSVGFKILDQLTLGYAYDFSTSLITPYAGSTHEVIIGYQFGKDKEKIYKRLNKIDSVNMKQDSALNSLDTTMRKMMGTDSANANIVKNFETLKNYVDRTKMELNDSIYKNKFRVGEKFTLTRIYFKTNQATLLQGSRQELEELASVLQRYPKLEIEILGYTDHLAGEEYNRKLGEKRAKSVYDYLVANGVSKDRLKYTGVGKNSYVADNDSDAGRQMNRRVEFKVTKM